MKKSITLWLASGLLCLFILLTFLVQVIDVKTIGPQGSAIGFATFNLFIFKLTGVHLLIYHITDWMGLIPIAIAFIFAFMGLIQWTTRRSLIRVDCSIRLLGIFYLILIAIYLFFEMVIINRRPILIDGYLEASYPSSHVLMVLCLMGSANMAIRKQTIHRILKVIFIVFSDLVMILTLVGRIVSGVHWATDIIAGVLFASSWLLYYKHMIQ
ncbi:MAG: phosphatase PAP2 family protein [Bacilli bacterium]|nr:phosphatase PAP2 family protein [Bacilli bacterium]